MNRYLSHLPDFFSKIAEFRALGTICDSSLEALYDAFSSVGDGLFADTAQKDWLCRHEDFCGVKTNVGKTLEERRFHLLTVTNGELPYTMKTLKEKLSYFLDEKDYVLVCDPVECSLTVTIGVEAESAYGDICEMLRRIVPANMALNVRQQYKTYGEITALGYTNEEMSAYTHDEYRRGLYVQ